MGGEQNDACHIERCSHRKQHSQNNYSADNTACNPFKPLEAERSEHSSMVLTLFCHAALLALPTASPPLSAAAQSQPAGDTEEPLDNSAVPQLLLGLW